MSENQFFHDLALNFFEMPNIQPIHHIIELAQKDAFSYDLSVYLMHIDELLKYFDKSIINNKSLVVSYYEAIKDMLQGIMLSFKKDFIPLDIIKKIIYIILPNWGDLTTPFFKEKQLDDTLIDILSLLSIKRNFPNINIDGFLAKYNCVLSPIYYNAFCKRVWYS